jgi:hypothetical protein
MDKTVIANAIKETYEDIALRPFREMLKHYSLQGYSKQGLNNRMPLKGNGYYQFGDLRVDTADRHIIVEVESGGGITNLAKYWFCIESSRITKPIVLLHLFQCSSKDDYISHRLLWTFLSERMCDSMGDKFVAYLYTYHPSTLQADLSVALSKFEELLQNDKACDKKLC